MMRRWLITGAVLVVGASVLAYYTRYLLRDELRPWDRYEVLFENVRGLEAEDRVMARGATIGRVKAIELYEDRQRVILEVEPGTEFYPGATVKATTLNAIGLAAVEIEPGEPGQGERLPVGSTLKTAVVEPGVSFAPTPAGRAAAKRQLGELARLTERIQIPESGFLGGLMFARDRAVNLDQGLTNLERQWGAVADSMGRLAGAEGLLNPESQASARRGVQTLRGTMRQLRDSLQAADRGDGGPGRFVADPAVAVDWREDLGAARDQLDASVRGEGTLGQLLHDPHAPRALEGTVEGLREATGAARRGEGLLGQLSDGEAGAGLRAGLRGARSGTQGLLENPAIRHFDVREAAEDTFGNVEDGLLNLRRGLNGFRAALPARSSLQGAVFAVF